MDLMRRMLRPLRHWRFDEEAFQSWEVCVADKKPAVAAREDQTFPQCLWNGCDHERIPSAVGAGPTEAAAESH